MADVGGKGCGGRQFFKKKYRGFLLANGCFGAGGAKSVFLFIFVVFSASICGKLRFYGACPFISQECAPTKLKLRDNSFKVGTSAKEK